MLTKTVSWSKRLYRYAAVMALINCAALSGAVGYLVATGKIDARSLQRAAIAFRGEQKDSATADRVSDSPVLIAGESGQGSQVDNLAAKAQMDVEILHREAERVKVELAQRLALNKSILVQVENERDAFRREQELQKRRQEESEKQVQDEGFQKQLAIFEALSPKVAVQHLLGMTDFEEAAKILKSLEPDRARKIIEAARRDPELSQMQMIVQKVRDVGPVPATEEAEPTP